MSFKSFSESNWTTFFENKDGGLYHNWDSLRIVDNSVFLLEKNLRKKPPKGEVSCRIRYIETNCKTLMSRTLDQPTWVPGGDHTSGYAREGQNSVVREIIMRIERAKNG